MELARKAGNGTAPTLSPKDVATKAATAQVRTDPATPATDGLAAGSKPRPPWIGIARSALAALCLSPLLVAVYARTVPHAPMKGQDGTWASDDWQNDIPSGFRTRVRGGEIAFYAPQAGDGACGASIGSAPMLGDDAGARADGTIAGTAVTLSRDHGLLAVSYKQYDPWVFFSRGPPPRRAVTVRFHQTAADACSD